MKIREVSVQQINAALNDLTRDIDIKIKQIESLNNEIKNMQSKLEALTKAVNGDLTALDEAIGDNIEYINNNFVPNTRTVNGKALDQNISLTASDVGALPDSTVIPAAQVNSDWNATSGVAKILNKPTIPTVVNSVTSGNMNAVTSNAVANYVPQRAITADSAATATTAGSANTASSCSGNAASATYAVKLQGNYTGSGGQQNPQYVGKNRVCANMMNTSINSNSQYKDFIMMDCYSGFDVGGTTAIGVCRQSMRVFAMRANAGTSPNRPTSWADTCEINTTTYTQIPTSKPSIATKDGMIWVQ